jgi:hypothetical protein
MRRKKKMMRSNLIFLCQGKFELKFTCAKNVGREEEGIEILWV